MYSRAASYAEGAAVAGAATTTRATRIQKRDTLPSDRAAPDLSGYGGALRHSRRNATRRLEANRAAISGPVVAHDCNRIDDSASRGRDHAQHIHTILAPLLEIVARREQPHRCEEIVPAQLAVRRHGDVPGGDGSGTIARLVEADRHARVVAVVLRQHERRAAS